MNDGHTRGRQWILRVQSAFVLPLARGIYLLVALACLLTVIGGIIYVAFLQASAASQPTLETLPPAYQESGTIDESPPREVDLSVIEDHLAAPGGLRFSVTIGTITAPIDEGALLGHFQASTLNRLAGFPDGVSLLGGRDAHLFERVQGPNPQLIGLAPRPALLTEIEQALQGISEQSSRTFEVRVIARDRYGITSEPTDLSFDLTFGPPPADPVAVRDPVPEPDQGQDITELQQIARTIAQTIEPTVNPAQFEAYRVALEVPRRCGARDDDATFLANYRQAFESVKPRIRSTNLDAFYTGLCEAWEAVLQREAAARMHAEQQQRAAYRAAEEARAQVEARNRQIALEHQAKVEQATEMTTVTLSVIGGAVGLFLSVALLLAFLAIEGHSRAMRAAVESMVRLAEQRETGSSSQGSV